MNRDIVSKDIQSVDPSNLLLELPTSFGKTKQALDLMNRRKPESILILVPRLALMDNWKEEFTKWKLDGYLKYVTFSTYVGIKRHKDKSFDMLIADECHHFTEMSLGYIDTMKFKWCVLLSATVGKFKDGLKCHFKGLYCYQVTAKKAIDEGILPDPRVYLIPYKLDNTNRKYPLELKNSSKGKKITCDYGDRWKYLKDKSYTSITVLCTQAEYIHEIGSRIEYWKRMYMRSKNDVIKNKWLYLAGLRLKMLGTFKNPIVQDLQVLFKDYRSLTFCNSIEQTEILGKNCINSKNKDSIEILKKFNQKKINHIASCNMLNEGMNLIDCQVGIYASLNSSDTMIKQKLGRLLRHPDPVLVIPYYNNTREEEIIGKMLEDYNPELVTVVESLNQIKV